MRGTALLIILVAVTSVTVLADSSDAYNVHVQVHANGDSEVTGDAVARADNGNLLDPADLPAIPDGWAWFTCPRPGPGQAVDADLALLDFSKPILYPMSIYAWDPADNPGPTPSDPSEPTAVPTGIPEVALLAVLCILAGLAWKVNGN